MSTQLFLTVKSPVDVHVKSAGTDEYPNLDRALVKLFSKTGHSPIVTAEELAGRTAVKVPLFKHLLIYNLRFHILKYLTFFPD